eukprot:scaffold36306_cov62-Phaeocystis_antarctica.AAC.3
MAAAAATAAMTVAAAAAKGYTMLKRSLCRCRCCNRCPCRRLRHCQRAVAHTRFEVIPPRPLGCIKCCGTHSAVSKKVDSVTAFLTSTGRRRGRRRGRGHHWRRRARCMHVQLGLADSNIWAGNLASRESDQGAHGVPPMVGKADAAIEQRGPVAALQPSPVGAPVRCIHRLVPVHCTPLDADHGIAALLPQLARPQWRAFELGPVQLEENFVVWRTVHPFELVEDRELRRARVVWVDRPLGVPTQPARAAYDAGLAGEEHATDAGRRWRLGARHGDAREEQRDGPS